jgi:hypothetical protein
MATATASHKRIRHQLPQPQRPWTDHLLDWKIEALGRVREQLEHVCPGPHVRPKSFSLIAAVRHVVAAEADPDSGLGMHLQHMLTGAIAQDITRRTDLLEVFHHRFPAHNEVSPAFLTKYVNSRWWCEVFCEMEHTCCRDVMGAVDGAIASARDEQQRR